MRRSKSSTPSEPRRSTGMEQPYPSSPSVPPKYCLYMRYPHDAPEGEARLLIVNFYGTYAAKKTLEAVIGDDEYKWKMSNKSTMLRGNPDTIITSRGVKIREPSALDEIIEYEYTREEEAWEVPPEKLRTIRSFLRPYPDEAIPSENGKHEEEPLRRDRAERTPRPSREGLVNISEICERLRLEPRNARAILRKAQIAKPEQGWAWPADEAAKIEAEIKSRM